MTNLNVQLPARLKRFAEKQAEANGLSDASEYVQSLLTREEQKRAALAELEGKLQKGLDSGKSIEVNLAYWAQKRAKLLGRTSRKRKSA